MPQYDPRFRQLIANNINAGASVAEIVEGLNVYAATVYNYRRNISSFGVHNPPPSSNRHRPWKIYVAAREALTDLLKANPNMYLDEIQEWLINEWDIDIYISNIL